MPIFTENSFTTGPRFLEELPVDLGTAIKTRFSFSRRLSAGQEIEAMAELNFLEAERARGLPRDGNIYRAYPVEIHTPISVEEANLQGEPFGLQFAEATTQEAVDELIKRRKKFLIQSSTLAGAPKGFTAFALGLGADMAGQMSDPLTLVASLIPLFKETRTAALVTRTVGPRAARPILGGLEGAVGNALVEPAVLAGTRMDQEPYTVANSMLNVAFGAGMGASFRTFGGEISDFVKKRERYRAARVEAEDVVLAEARIRGEIEVAKESKLQGLFDDAKKLEAEGQTAKAGEIYREIAEGVEDFPSAERDAVVRRIMDDRLPDDLKNPTNTERLMGMNSLTHEVSLRMAMAQNIQGQRVNIMPIVERDPGYIQPFLSAEEKAAIADRKVEDLEELLKTVQGHANDLGEREGVRTQFMEKTIRDDRRIDIENDTEVMNEMADREAILDASIKVSQDRFGKDILPGAEKGAGSEGGPIALNSQIAELKATVEKGGKIAEGIRKLAQECFGGS